VLDERGSLTIEPVLCFSRWLRWSAASPTPAERACALPSLSLT